MIGTMRNLQAVMQEKALDEETVDQRKSLDVGIVDHREDIAAVDKAARGLQ